MNNISKKISFIINRDTITIFTLAFISDFSGGIITPIAVLYARSLGASFTFIGSLASIQSLIFIFFALPFGIYSDRKGRKSLILIGRLITSLNFFLFFNNKFLSSITPKNLSELWDAFYSVFI